ADDLLLCRRRCIVRLVIAHAPEMAAEELLAHVRTDRLGLLGKRAAKLSPEQRTLTAALQHSYALLTPAEQRALRMVSVFDGGAGLDGAAALGIDMPVVQALTDKSLVRLESVGDVRRVRLLETVREYALMLLMAAGEFDDAQQRRLAWCVALAEAAAPLLHSGEQTHWLQRLEAERYNVYTAIQFSVSAHDIASAMRMVIGLRHFFVARGHLAEIAPWLDIVEYEATGVVIDPGLWARFLNCKGTVAFYRAQYDLAGAYFLAALKLAEGIGDRQGIAYALDGLGAGAANNGNRPVARACSTASLEHSTAVGDHWLAGIALMNLGEIARMENDLVAAAQFYGESLTRLQLTGDPFFIAVAQINLGQVYLHQGDRVRAQVILHQSLASGLQAESAQVVAPALEKLADVLVEQQAESGQRLFGLAQGLRQRSGVTVQPVDQADHDRTAARCAPDRESPLYLQAAALGARMDWRALHNALDSILAESSPDTV
ncbi:MAG: hypothetical protein R6W76_11605, partial [Caldilinea sp.]